MLCMIYARSYTSYEIMQIAQLPPGNTMYKLFGSYRPGISYSDHLDRG